MFFLVFFWSLQSPYQIKKRASCLLTFSLNHFLPKHFPAALYESPYASGKTLPQTHSRALAHSHQANTEAHACVAMQKEKEEDSKRQGQSTVQSKKHDTWYSNAATGLGNSSNLHRKTSNTHKYYIYFCCYAAQCYVLRINKEDYVICTDSCPENPELRHRRPLHTVEDHYIPM